MMALLVVLKLAAVSTSYASGNAGGVFAPSLFMGAMFGGTLGSIAHHLLPGYTASPGAYAIVGMGTLFAGIIRAPMTSVLMIFETTQDYAVIVPVMISNLVSYFVASQIQPRSIYGELARQDGVHLPGPERRAGSSHALVASVLRPPQNVLSANATIEEAIAKARDAEFAAWLVTDDRGLVGVLGVDSLRREPPETRSRALGELTAELKFPHVHIDHPLYTALERMGKEKLQILPVVSRVNVRHILGVVTLADVLDAYGFEHNEIDRSPSPSTA
jgi:CIC family chloride channel protein